MSAWFILENLLNGIVDVNDVNICHFQKLV